MIELKDGIFNLSTTGSTYLFCINSSRHLEHLYYGQHLDRDSISSDALFPILTNPIGTGVAYTEEDPTMLEITKQEISTPGKGDFRESCIRLTYDNGMDTLDFLYQNHQLFHGKPRTFTGLPESYGAREECDSLQVTLAEKKLPLRLILTYTVYTNCDVITRKAYICNDATASVMVKNLSSLQLDLDDSNWDLITFNGAWARERHIDRSPLSPGIRINDSKTGVSGAEHNPCIFLARKDCDELHGECLATNLVYSGNHRESIEVSPYGQTRILTGINSYSFNWELAPGEHFATPEAIMTYSGAGLDTASRNLHYFINNHIVRGYWQNRQRPVVVNNWEATYFNFNEDKLLSLAKTAKKVGAELFVLDDGWFGARDDDTSSLGDWVVNTSKLSSGLGAFSFKIHQLGLMFGLWVEPEMVSRNSNLFDTHPDWAIMIPGRAPSVGRHQFILDLTREDVRDYLLEALTKIFALGQVDYVKWDMNRVFSDIASRNNDIRDMGEFNHRYVLGLYDLLDKLTRRFPKILFESCASGGNRFDLGMLCFMPQTWTSDDTDALERIYIQEGTSYGYPLSAMCCHVSSVPNHQTLRKSNIETRFNIAAFGNLGYELDLTELSASELEIIAEQIAFYKAHRNLFQYGTFIRLLHDTNTVRWAVMNPDKTEMLLLDFRLFNKPNPGLDVLKFPVAAPKTRYEVYPRPQRIPMEVFGKLADCLIDDISYGKIKRKETAYIDSETVHYSVTGEFLAKAGIHLTQTFGGTGYDGHLTRVLDDQSSRLYVFIRAE
ncbi:MAG: alpha-galactosidase [Spirochaetia bacterium]|nr:alpha-galactosidase [Spirochaetia bacterium]